MATVLGLYQEALRLLGDARLATVSDDTPARYALDDAYDAAVLCVLRSAPWRFALKTVEITGTTSATLLPGYSHKFARPADWARTHAIFVLASGSARELPIDVREQDDQFYANVADIHVRYVSQASGVLDEGDWPEQFAKAVAVRLAFDVAERITGNPARTGQMLELYQRAVEDAIVNDAVPESPWLVRQLDGGFLSSARITLQAGNWRFALKSATLSAESPGSPLPGFDDSYAKPADWLRTQAVFAIDGSRECPMDVREHGSRWSANTAPTVRYVSTDFYDPTTWPEDFTRVVAAHLGLSWGDGGIVRGSDGNGEPLALWPQYLSAALSREAIAESPWLRFQFTGTFYRCARWLLDQAFWRFAVKTVELTGTTADVSPGYTYSVAKPADWGRTMFLYRTVGTDWRTIDFRDEDGKLHFQFEDVVLRYISTDGEDPTTWTDGFMAALLAYLEYEGAKNIPDAAGAQIQARFTAWKDAFKTARLKDDLNERPRFNDRGRLVDARRGGTVHGLTREQG